MKLIYFPLFISFILVLECARSSKFAFNRQYSIRHTHNINARSALFFSKSTSEDSINSENGNLQSGEFEVDEEELIKRLNFEIMNESGVELDQLINPSKVVNLERDVMKLENQKLKTFNSNELQIIEDSIQKKKGVLLVERRSVMRGWLKQLFVFQSLIAVIASLGMVYNAIPGYDLPLSIKVLGFWMWWLFIIPSLRGLVCIDYSKLV